MAITNTVSILPYFQSLCLCVCVGGGGEGDYSSIYYLEC